MLGTIGGFVLEKFKLEKYLSPWVKQIQSQSETETAEWESHHIPFMKRVPTIVKDAWSIARGVLVYVVIGIAIGATMHRFVPEGFFEVYLAKVNWYSITFGCHTWRSDVC